MGYWEDVNEFNEKQYERYVKFLKLQHGCKMEELDKEVELFKLKAKEKK